MNLTMQNGVSKQTEQYLKKFERFERESKQPAWLFPLRKAGMARFAELGFPTLKHEDWRFTNVAPIAKLPFNPVFEADRDGLTRESIAQLLFGGLDAIRLVFVNGHYCEELSSPVVRQPGVTVKNLAAALKTDSALIEQHLARHATGEDN